MKELSIEEKAKRYDEAINEIKNLRDILLKEGVINENGVICDNFNRIFPELKESEDKKIRKWLIGYLNNKILNSTIIDEKKACKDAIAWVEKQGKHKSVKCIKDEALSKLLNKVICRFINNPDIPYSERDEVSVKLIPYVEMLEKQGEQNPPDKVGPKFKVGDFIVSDYCMGKVIELTNDAYLLDTGQGIPFSCEHNAHLWDITKDAKDGDVLVSEDGWICVFKGNLRNELFDSYCFMDSDGWFCLSGSTVHTLDYRYVGQFYPATKEQRDQLFKAMHDAGYEWDAEKKELKKIEQKPAWSEEDEQMLNHIICNIESIKEQVYCKTLCDEEISWLKSLKDRVQPKQGWSEEDENRINRLITYFEDRESFSAEDDLIYANWLKSLRPQNTWKPSEEQMKALDDFIYAKYPNIEKYGAAVKSLYQDLKKLKEE